MIKKEGHHTIGKREHMGGSTVVGHKAQGAGENMGRRLYFGFFRKDWERWVYRFSIAWFE